MRESSRAAFLYTVILAVLLIIAAAWRTQAHAHSWYTGQHNPTNLQSCCGGNDCWEVDLSWISEDADNYIVTIPGPRVPNLQGLSATYQPGSYSIPKADAQPTPSIDTSDGQEHSGYHACIWGGKLRCFFFPSGS